MYFHTASVPSRPSRACGTKRQPPPKEVKNKGPVTLVIPTDYQGHGRVKWDNWRDALTPELQKRGILIEVGGHGYQNFLKGMKPSTRQRFVSLRFDFPANEREESILIGESGCTPDLARRLVSIAHALRTLKDQDLEEAASTRLLVYAALLVRDGMDPVTACRAAIVESLTDDPEVADALMEVVSATFGR